MATNKQAELKQGTEQYIAKQFVEKIKTEFLPDISIQTQGKLQYSNIFNEINEKGLGVLSKTKIYTTDILICEKNVPRVVIEVKQKTYTTHDIITYSEKAKSHKRLFPQLRYGFLCLEAQDEKLKGRYYQHSNGFDFGHCITKENEDKFLSEYIEIIKEQIKISQELEKEFF